MTPDNRYASFMLRFQWMKNDKQPTWIVSMQRVGTGELRWFPNLDALITFLREEFGDADLACGSSETEDRGDTALQENDRLTPGSR